MSTDLDAALIAGFDLPGSDSAWVEVRDFGEDDGLLSFVLHVEAGSSLASWCPR